MKKAGWILAGVFICALCIGCHFGKKKSTRAEPVLVGHCTLFDKSLPEIKEYIKGEWKLVSGKNVREVCEYDNTFIQFDGDEYVWTEDDTDEPGDLNWRKTETGAGYDAYVMDVFYAEHPAYPLAINGDTLYIQDCSETGYKYTLVRK